MSTYNGTDRASCTDPFWNFGSYEYYACMVFDSRLPSTQIHTLSWPTFKIARSFLTTLKSDSFQQL